MHVTHQRGTGCFTDWLLESEHTYQMRGGHVITTPTYSSAQVSTADQLGVEMQQV